jgi:hypothetical protein
MFAKRVRLVFSNAPGDADLPAGDMVPEELPSRCDSLCLQNSLPTLTVLAKGANLRILGPYAYIVSGTTSSIFGRL